MKYKKVKERSLKVLDHFLNNMGYWEEVESLAEDLTEEEKAEVSDYIATSLIPQIRKKFGM